MDTVSTSFTDFAMLCDCLAATPKKLEKRAQISGWLKTLALRDAALGALYLAGQPFAETDARVLNLGGATLSRALAQLSRVGDAAMREVYRKYGDLGAAAEELLSHQAGLAPTLTLADVEEFLAGIAAARGAAGKLPLALRLLHLATPVEAKYLIKLALSDMRTGVKESLVEEAIAAAFEADPVAVRRATMMKGSLPEVVRLAAAGKLDEARMSLFHPLGFMLASPVDSVAEALGRFAQEIAAERTPGRKRSKPLPVEDGAGEDVIDAPAAISPEASGTALRLPPEAIKEAQIEDKYDGIRTQLHCGDPSQPGRVVLFSRSREDMTAAFPEVAEAFAAVASPLILDGEVLAWDLTNARALPFSCLQARIGRKKVSGELRQQVPVVFMAFDLLYLDGELLLERTLVERRALLEEFAAEQAPRLTAGSEDGLGTARQSSLFTADERLGVPRLMLSPITRLASAEQLDRAYLEARSRGNEGVMIKALGSLYQPGRRGMAWLKLKRELATLDVVVTAAEFGHGKRAGILSDYTFAVRDGEVLKNVGKAYSGLTDVEIAELSQFFMEHTIEDFGHLRSVEAVLVLEVAFNNVMRSERHASGFALRFPRIVRIRRDKPVTEIDTLARVEEIFASQPDKAMTEGG